MSPRGLLLLATVTLGSVALAAHAVMTRDVPVTTVAFDAPLLPGLAEKLDRVAAIKVRFEDKTATVRRGEKGWVIEELDGYPVDPEKVQGLARSLVSARLLEAKTDRPERWARLDLDEPGSPRPDGGKSRAKELVLLDAEGKKLAELVVGKTRYGAFGPGRGAVYVRRAEDGRAWLLDRRIEVPEEPIDWIDRQIVDLPSSSIARVVLRPGSENQVVVARASGEAGELALEPLPAGRTPDKDKLERLASALSSLSLQAVRRASEIAFPEDAPRARFETVDGLVVEAVVRQEGEGNDAVFWVRFAAAAGEASPGASSEGAKPAAEQARALAQRLDGWAFKLAKWSAERLVWTVDELLEPAEKTS
ncbi:MAG: DUF4340 domain-containing protein [Geminicoccaceae bacterium]|nr:DUF4340 domain-containing protein [Geminicoccaceae bacterium]MCX8102594.1 DUF4340 domain-containing protein [Geminicoccaceae bacterium]MDW8369633.1 DUF4340 domain-containing protein [Geminicoccaceae bacterium]